MHSCWSSVLNDYFILCYKVGTTIFWWPFVSICSWEFKLPMFTMIINGKSKYKLHIFQAFILLMYRNRTELWHHCTVLYRTVSFVNRFTPYSYIDIYFFLVGEGSVKCICESFGVVCELVWVQGVWDDGVDMCRDQAFKEFHGYRCECYRAMVI